jgi:hypothetical protein
MINEFIESRTRPIPLIETYNSNLVNTRRMVPNDILHVQVQGLDPEKEYTVTVLDPEGKAITQMIALPDENGVIKPTPLWYDIGFEMDDDGVLSLSEANLTVSAFNINVKDEDGETDFSLPFWFVSSNDNFERPQPIIYAGKQLTDGTFTMQNAFYSSGQAPGSASYPTDTLESEVLTDTVYFKIDNMTPLITPLDVDDENDPAYTQEVKLWVVPFTGDGFAEGDDLSREAYFSMDLTVGEIMDMGENGMLLPWPVEYPVTTQRIEELASSDVQNEVPYWAEELSFSLFLDMKDRGIEGFYNIEKEGFDSFYLDAIDGNGAAGFVVKSAPQTVTNYISMQLASGGIFRYVRVPYTVTYGTTTYTYNRYEYDYDYRDEFKYNAYDTKYSSHSGPFWGYGVKVIWNPYQTTSGWTSQGVDIADIPSSFWGRTVNVYIVEVDTNGDPINNTDGSLKPAPGTIMNRVPVQYGCSNGWWQQTIWRTPMSAAYADKDYMIVVDMDSDGELSENDLVDDVRTDSGEGGFSIVTNYN